MEEKNKLPYFSHSLSHTFKIKKPFYVFWIPINKSCYQKLKESVGSDMDWSVGMIEQGKMFGRGKIGVASNDGTGDWKIEGEFTAHEIVGEYSQMKMIYPQVMKENPQAKEFYTLYITDPAEVPMEENKTLILFR